jgi:hypothetical protein
MDCSVFGHSAQPCLGMRRQHSLQSVAADALSAQPTQACVVVNDVVDVAAPLHELVWAVVGAVVGRTSKSIVARLQGLCVCGGWRCVRFPTHPWLGMHRQHSLQSFAACNVVSTAHSSLCTVLCSADAASVHKSVSCYGLAGPCVGSAGRGVL